MIDYDDEFEYAATRLDGTFCLWHGRLVFVNHVCGDTGKAHIVKNMGDDELREREVNVMELDVEPPQLGYVNTPDEGLAYIMRKPMRRDWRQGMRENNLMNLLGDMIDIWQLQHVIDNDYPSIGDCLGENRAFSRDWAVVNGFLHHRTYHVGTAGEKGITLFPENDHLIESLTEVLKK